MCMPTRRKQIHSYHTGGLCCSSMSSSTIFIIILNYQDIFVFETVMYLYIMSDRNEEWGRKRGRRRKEEEEDEEEGKERRRRE